MLYMEMYDKEFLCHAISLFDIKRIMYIMLNNVWSGKALLKQVKLTLINLHPYLPIAVFENPYEQIFIWLHLLPKTKASQQLLTHRYMKKQMQPVVMLPDITSQI